MENSIRSIGVERLLGLRESNPLLGLHPNEGERSALSIRLSDRRRGERER
jgi:hypothetical protein